MAMTNADRQRRYRKNHRMVPVGNAEPFKAPTPVSMETYDGYLRRMVQAFEDWVNARYPVDSTKPA